MDSVMAPSGVGRGLGVCVEVGPGCGEAHFDTDPKP
jgi:hypothetical protein